jgi:ribosomal protein L25 (general stress protein Ctc)
VLLLDSDYFQNVAYNKGVISISVKVSTRRRRDMGDKITLTLSKRTEQGKKVARLRKEGLVPGVIYGQDFEPILVQSKYGDIEKVVREAGRHTPVVVTVDGKTKTTLIKDIDRDPVKATIRK